MEIKLIKQSIENSMDFWIASGTAQGCQKGPKRRDQLRSRNFTWLGRGGREGKGEGKPSWDRGLEGLVTC